MTDRLDTAKERERLALIAINEFEGAFCSCHGHRVHEATCDFIMVRNTFRTNERLLDALDAERAENERLRSALRAINATAFNDNGDITYDPSALGRAFFIARLALNPEGVE